MKTLGAGRRPAVSQWPLLFFHDTLLSINKGVSSLLPSIITQLFYCQCVTHEVNVSAIPVTTPHMLTWDDFTEENYPVNYEAECFYSFFLIQLSTQKFWVKFSWWKVFHRESWSRLFHKWHISKAVYWNIIHSRNFIYKNQTVWCHWPVSFVGWQLYFTALIKQKKTNMASCMWNVICVTFVLTEQLVPDQ